MSYTRQISKLYGIGVGPGDPELLTIKAYKILKEVDMIVTPRSSEDKRSLALLTIEGIINERKNKPIVVEPVFPMTKDQAKLAFYWEKAREEVLKNMKGCETVAFITLGDPSLYSTFYRFLEIFKDVVDEVEVVPGVTSFSACSSIAKVPIAEGNEIVSELRVGYPPETHVAVVHKASWAEERIIRGTLDDIAVKVKKEDIKSQSVIIVGDVLNKSGVSVLYGGEKKLNHKITQD